MAIIKSYLQRILEQLELPDVPPDTSGVQKRTVHANTDIIIPESGPRSIINGDFYSQPYLITPNYENWTWSTDPADEDGGAGASSIRIFGYADRESVDMTSSDSILLGTRKWGFSENFYRVEFAQVIGFGLAGNETNLGTITITNTSDGEPVAPTKDAIFIRPGQNVSHYAGFWVPSGKVAVISDVTIRNRQSVMSNVVLEVRSLQARSILDEYWVTSDRGFTRSYFGKIVLSQSDVQLVVEDVSSDTAIFGSISYSLIDEDLINLDNIDYVPGTRL